MGFYTRHTTWRAMFEKQPRMSFVQRFAPQDSVLVSGRIVNVEPERGPLLLAAVSSRYRENEIVSLTTVHDLFEGYTLFLPAGDYGFFVFSDVNRNGRFERNELVGQAPALVTASANSNPNGVLEGPAIVLNYEDPGRTAFPIRVKVRGLHYVQASLDNAFFDSRYGTEGLYNPAGFMTHAHGFLFGLEDYDEQKTSVLFVHGIGGTPRDWKFFVDGLDRTRFQPFFLYYPSGMPVDKIGSLLAQSLEVSRNGSHKIILAAHSMGGLVALSAVKKLAAEGLPSALKLYCSFSTPYRGVDSARKGVANAPLVVPVWKDIAPNSEFLQKLHEQPFPHDLPFYLFFTYHDPSTFKLGESSDGSIALSSQLDPGMQAAAIKLFGFNENHDDFLNSEAGRDQFLKLLDEVSPRTEEAGIGE